VTENTVKLLIKDLQDALHRLTVLLDETCIVVLEHEKRLQELEEHGRN
jgi:hypothetical protein